MAIATAALLAGGALAAGGLIAGLSDETTRTTSRVLTDPVGARERGAFGQADLRFGQLGQFADIGPGGQDITAALGAQRGLAEQFRQAGISGGLPTAGDIGATRGIAEQLFAPEQVALQQSFERQRQEGRRTAGRLGRQINDPVLLAKLAQQETQAGERFEARRGSVAQQLALQQPERRLGFAQQAAGIQSGLATQAFRNRAALLGIGQQIGQGERQFRLQTATRTGENVQEGSLAQGISGALGGFGQGLGLASGFGGLGGGGGGGGGGFGQSFSQSLGAVPLPNVQFGQSAPGFQALPQQAFGGLPNVQFGQSAPGFGGRSFSLQ